VPQASAGVVGGWWPCFAGLLTLAGLPGHCSTERGALAGCVSRVCVAGPREAVGGGAAVSVTVRRPCRDEAAKRVRERCIGLLTDYELCKQDGDDDCSGERDAYRACEQAAQQQGA